MLRRERRPVQLVGEDAPGLDRLGEREASLVALLDLALDAVVEAGEDDVDGGGSRCSLVEQRRELDPAPQPGADGLGQPRLADRTGVEERPAVPRALHRHRELDRGTRAQLVEGEGERALHGAAELEPPARRVDERDVVVDQEVVEPDRRDRPAERFERHRVVPCRKAQLVEADPGVGRDGHAADRSARDDPLSTTRASRGRAR